MKRLPGTYPTEADAKKAAQALPGFRGHIHFCIAGEKPAEYSLEVPESPEEERDLAVQQGAWEAFWDAMLTKIAATLPEETSEPALQEEPPLEPATPRDWRTKPATKRELRRLKKLSAPQEPPA
jgi:hypothetical protein